MSPAVPLILVSVGVILLVALHRYNRNAGRNQ